MINSHPIFSLPHNPNNHHQSKKMEGKAAATATEVPADEKKADEAKTVEDKKDGADETAAPPADDAAPKKDDEAKATEDAPKDDAKMTDKDDKVADEAPKDGDEAKKDEEVSYFCAGPCCYDGFVREMVKYDESLGGDLPANPIHYRVIWVGRDRMQPCWG